MIEYINLFILLVMFGSTCYVYYRLKKIFYLISIVMDSEILDQLTNLGRDVDSEFPKPKRGRKKKADPRVNELEDNDVRDKRERLVIVFYLVTQNNKKRSHTQLDSRKQVIAFQDRVITINIKEAQHPLK